MDEASQTAALVKAAEDLTGWADPARRLRYALEKDELALYCQPIASLQGGARFPMAEVLVRLREEEKALLPPGEFIPVFEHYHLMPDLDRWVVRHIAAHIKRGSNIARFAVNLDSQTIEDAAFPKAVAEILAAQGVPTDALYFEISETDTIDRVHDAARFANAIRKVGCGVTVSGFGHRTATFLALKNLKPDFVKVDGSIVRRLLSAPTAEAKLRAILRVGEVVGYRVIAEMVEDQDILLRLKALGVGYAQGFGIQQPHPIEYVAIRRPRI